MRGRLPGVLAVIGVPIVAAGIIAAALVLPGVNHASAAAGERLPTSRVTTTLVCPGPETQLVPDGGQAVDPGGPVVLRALAASPVSPAPAVSSASSSPPSASSLPSSASLKLFGDWIDVDSDLSSGGQPRKGRQLQLDGDPGSAAFGSVSASALGPAVLTSDSTPSLAALQSTLARSGDLRALTATSCSPAEPDSWLVGGGTADGERLRLLLANPAATSAVVDVDVRGPRGRVDAPSGQGVVVPAHGEVPIYLDALAPHLDRVAVHVSTRSGRIAATLYDSMLRGLSPAGADDVQPTAPPAKRQVVPGISLVNGYSATADDPMAAGSTAVRVAVPGSEEAVVRVRLLNSNGQVELPRTAVVTVPPQGVVDVPISGIPSGNYTAVVDADVPVVAGALIGRSGIPGTAAASEFAWAPAARWLTGGGYVMLPPDAHSTFSVVALGGAGRVEFSEIHSDGTIGEPTSFSLNGGTSAVVGLSAAAVGVKFTEVAGKAVAASIVSTVDDPRGTLITVLPVTLDATVEAPRSAVEDSRLGLH